LGRINATSCPHPIRYLRIRKLKRKTEKKKEK